MVGSDRLNAPATGTSSHSSNQLGKTSTYFHYVQRSTFAHLRSVLTVHRLSMLI